MVKIEQLRRITEIEFADIVSSTIIVAHKLRITLQNQRFIDVHLSQKLPDKFGFHWECTDPAGTLYRYDNFPDRNWRSVSTYPFHFHNGSQDDVEPSPFPFPPVEGFRAFMVFVRERLSAQSKT